MERIILKINICRCRVCVVNQDHHHVDRNQKYEQLLLKMLQFLFDHVALIPSLDLL